jgi:hypothetical protein
MPEQSNDYRVVVFGAGGNNINILSYIRILDCFFKVWECLENSLLITIDVERGNTVKNMFLEDIFEAIYENSSTDTSFPKSYRL